MGRWFSKPVPKPSEPTLARPKSRIVQHESPKSERVKSNRESVEARAFRKCFSLLADGISDPGRLAIQLYSEGFIGPDLRAEAQKTTIKERVKIEELLSAVENRIISNPATIFRVFVDVLRDEPSLQHLATKLESTCREMSGLYAPNPPLTPVPSGPHIDTYASYLKSVYTREKLPMYDKWPQVESKKFVNLALIGNKKITKHERDDFTRATIHGNIDDIKQSKRAMDMSQVAQLPDGSHPKCILVEGAPGVGKSTFAWKLCRRWGKGKSLQQYKLVVLLRLRDKTVRASKSISDLFQYRDHQVQQAVIEEIQRTGGRGVLLMFEGYDELPEEMRIENSVFLDVITGRELPEATVLVTSRSWASEFLHRECKKHISQHIEILGFAKDNIMSYLESTTSNDPSLLASLKKYISCYPHINSAMYIPLNAAIVVEVYRNSRKDEMLVPKTMTELYSSLVRSLLLRHLLNHPVHGQKRKWRVRNFSDLPSGVYQQLCELGRIAYEGIVHGQQVIFSDLPEDFETLGLMQCVPELYADEGAAVSYNFLHLTVQEYLAAFHLSQQPVEKQIEHYQEYSTGGDEQMTSHFQMVLRFLSGLRKFGGYPKKMLNTLCKKITFVTLHWLFEAQDSNVFAELLGLSDVVLSVIGGVVTPFDCFVLGYCVSHSNCTWKIDLDYCHIGDEGVEMLVRGAVEEDTNCTGGISKIILRQNNITTEGVKHLLKIPRKLNNLGTLSLRFNDLNSESCVTLTQLIPHMPHLKELDLSDNVDIGPGGAVLLIRSLTAQNSLEKLNLFYTGIGVEDCRALSELLSSSTSLKYLKVGYYLPPEGVELIISGLHHNTTLKQLHVDYSHFSPQNTISLAAVMTTNHTLVDLALADCHIDSDGACRLASALCANDTLQVLNISDNPIGVKGAAAFAEVLLTNKSLKQLYLCDDSIGDEGTQRLIESLTHSSPLEELYLPKKYKPSILTTTDQDLIRISRTDRVVWF